MARFYIEGSKVIDANTGVEYLYSNLEPERIAAALNATEPDSNEPTTDAANEASWETARLSEAPHFTVTTTAGANGTVTPAGAVPVVADDVKVFVATPEPGYRVAAWQVDGGAAPDGAASGNTLTIGVGADRAVAVTFEVDA